MRALPTAIYHLLLRDGVNFAAAERLLPALSDLGISHLYLSPVMTAASGSTHGYDVADPTTVDPVLGGEAGFMSLADVAMAAGIGLILDFVPNHTVFSPDNVWLRDVLRFGPTGRYGGHFDIDWSRGPLLLPFLPDDFQTCAAEGLLRLVPGADGQGAIAFDGGTVPLAPGSWDGRTGIDPDALAYHHDRQLWRLTQGGVAARIRHRRFFNVTELVGMRIDDPQVFADMHDTLFRLIDAGAVQGLRLDHIDGLADPAAYLNRLAARVGEVPIWVEKILTGDERLPAWPVLGTTGYAAVQAITRVLTDPDGLTQIDRRWRVDGGADSFAQVLDAAKRQILDCELASELRQLAILGRAALSATDRLSASVTDADLTAALRELLIACPRYRTYLTAGPRRAEDVAVLAAMREVAAQTVGGGHPAVDWLHAVLLAPRVVEGTALAIRFEQVTGALLAKAGEDTAGYRYARLIAACEVGSDPDAAVMSPVAFGATAAAHPASAWVLTSSHDTKRSADVWMRVLAITHRADDFLALADAAAALTAARHVPARLRWYILQSALGLWGDADFGDRLTAHLTKAMRETKDLSDWDDPDTTAEDRAQAFLAALIADWHDDPPLALRRLLEQGDTLGLIGAALGLVVPGIPCVFQGCEGQSLLLTDPDNRRPARIGDVRPITPQDRDKRALSRHLLHLRRAHPGFFTDADCTVATMPGGGWMLIRRDGDSRLHVTIADPDPVPLRIAIEGRLAGSAASRDIWPQTLSSGEPGRTPKVVRPSQSSRTLP